MHNERNNWSNLNVLVGSELITATAPPQPEKNKKKVVFPWGQCILEKDGKKIYVSDKSGTE